MAVRFLAGDVSDLCLGKPALRTLPVSATAAEAIEALKRSRDRFIGIWSCDHSTTANGSGCECVGMICVVDVICFLCREENLANPGSALQSPVTDLLPKEPGLVRHLDSTSSLLEAIDCMLEGAQNLVVPIERNRSIGSRKKHLNKPPPPRGPTLHNGHEFCFITQEDVVRFLLNFISVFSPIPALTVEALSIIDTDITTIHFNDPVSSSLDSITRTLSKQKPVAIIDEENKLMGELSPYTLASCEEAVAAAFITLSAGDLMAFIDYGGPKDLVHLVQTRLEEKNLSAMMEFMDELSLSLASSSTSCSSDEEFGLSQSCGSGRFSPARRSEATLCHPWSSLAAVMIQALAHRVNYVWVIEEDCNIVGVVTFSGILKVLGGGARERPDIENSFKQ